MGLSLWEEVLIGTSVVVFVTVAVSAYLMYLHFSNYTQPRHQRCIVRLIFMVPLYAIYSLMCLFFPVAQRYLAVFRDAYEAYALYMFFVLCVEYVGGKERMIVAFESCSETKLVIPLWCMVNPNRRLLKICRQGILQYAILRPVVSVVSTVLMIIGLYEEGSWDFTQGYPYATLFYNIGVTVSLYCLALFYKIAREELRPFSPVTKFAVVKGIVFFTYWQSVIISIAIGIEILPTFEGMDSGEVATQGQNLLICFEMLLFAFGFMYAFPVRMYKISSRSQAPLIHEIELNSGVLDGMKDASSQRDVAIDTIEAFVPGADPTSPNSWAQKRRRRKDQEAFDAGIREAREDSGTDLRLSFGNLALDDDYSSGTDSDSLPDDDPRKENIRGRK